MIRDWGPLSEMGISNPSGAWLWDSKQQTSEPAERQRKSARRRRFGRTWLTTSYSCWLPAVRRLLVVDYRSRQLPFPMNGIYIEKLPTSQLYFSHKLYSTAKPGSHWILMFLLSSWWAQSGSQVWNILVGTKVQRWVTLVMTPSTGISLNLN